MKNVNDNELLAVDGGGKCQGIWLGTYDGQYGLCLGHWDN